MNWLLWIFPGFAILRLTVAVVNWLSRPYLPGASARMAAVRVSVLVPARDEEHNIGNLLGDLAAMADHLYEVIVYDDDSRDGTAAVVESRIPFFAGKLKFIRGGALPRGWLGKNHACHTLALHASGDYLLMVDADVRLRPDTVGKAAEYVTGNRLRLLSVFPRQVIDNPGSALTVPSMNWILLSLLPLAAVQKAPRNSLAAANGQFMFFDAQAYRGIWPHSEFRDCAVEDMAIVREYKKRGLRVATLLGRDDVSCRMYGGLGEAVDGFAKNIFQFFGGSRLLCYSFMVVTTLAPFVFFLPGGVVPGLTYLFAIGAVRLFTSLASRQSALLNILLMLPQHVILWVIVIKASIASKNNKLKWKNRSIY